jgi:Cytochrome C oxidase, cbb3-type, subunit III
MTGSCRRLWSLTEGRRGVSSTSAIFLLAGLLACGGDQRSGAVPADTSQSSVADTASTATRDTAADTTASTRDTSPAAVRPESTVTRVDTARRVAARPAPRKPASPAPAPPATQPTPPDTSTAAPAARDTAAAPSQTPETTTAAVGAPSPASAPLRDQYHQAPLDTVPQQVYDGWKQYNLNCARCHGEDVQGTTIAPHLIVSIKPDGPINTKELFVQTVCEGRPAKGMPGWCALGMEMPTIEAIYAYVKGRSDAKLHPGRPALKAGG